MDDSRVRIDRDTWIKAQAWELAAWKRNGNTPLHSVSRRLVEALRLKRRNVGDDYNFWWAKQFEGYRCLPRDMNNAVEFGCGPYTNMRIILVGRHIRHVVCSDPLAGEYVKFRGRWLAHAARMGLVCIDNHPLEECPFASEYFELTVLINVLDHVRDAQVCLRQCLRVTRPGGYIVLGQDLTDLSVDATPTEGAVGHPIHFKHSFLDHALAPVEPIFRKVLPRGDGRNPSCHYGTYLLIGRKG